MVVQKVKTAAPSKMQGQKDEIDEIERMLMELDSDPLPVPKQAESDKSKNVIPGQIKPDGFTKQQILLP